MKTYCIFFMMLITVLAQSQDNGNQQSTDIRLNDIQVIGSHNSYKIAIEKPLMDYLLNLNPATSSLEYEHISLSEQLNFGLRGLELDVFHDPEGGYHSNPAGLEIVRSAGQEPLPFDPEGKLKEAGLKIFHVQDIDFRSHQLLFKEALLELKEWSNSNPGHTPIIITMNTKDGIVPRTRDPLPFDAEALKNIDTEIRNVLSEEQLITPDLVRGNFKTLQEAVMDQGWPLLKEVKNRFLFVLDEGDVKSDLYLSQFPHLKGAVLFVNKKEGHAQAAFRIINDAVGKFDQIKELVAKGYMVRTRADSDTREARNNDYTKFEKAKASGAQIITTDYYIPSTLFESDYKVKFDDGKFERIKN